MSRRIIYSVNAPEAVQEWDPSTEDQVAGHWLANIFLPVVLTGVMYLVLAAVDGMLPGGQSPDNLDRWMEYVVFWTAPVLWASSLAYHIWRKGYIETRTDDNNLIKFDHIFRSLPRDLQADASALRQTAIHFSNDGNEKGMERCMKALHELRNSQDYRTTTRQNKEVMEAKEVSEAMEAAMQYRKETDAMYSRQLTDGSQSEPEVEVEEVEGEIVEGRAPYIPPQRRIQTQPDWWDEQ